MNWTDTLIPMALFALATSATPGPVNVISAMSGASFGPLRSLPYVMGATTSFVAILLLVGFGLNAIIDWIERFSLLLTLAGSAYMLLIAYRIAMDSGELRLTEMSERRPGFRAGLITQALNPKAWIVSLSAITIYVSPHLDYILRLGIFSALFFVICAVSLTGWAFVGFRVAKLTGNVARFNRLMAALLAISVFIILVSEISQVFSE